MVTIFFPFCWSMLQTRRSPAFRSISFTISFGMVVRSEFAVFAFATFEEIVTVFSWIITYITIPYLVFNITYLIILSIIIFIILIIYIINMRIGNNTKHTPQDSIVYLLAVLSKPGALRIFLLAKQGIKARTVSHYEIGLTRKQYYTRLSQLVKAGLVKKTGGRYIQTPFGTILSQDYIPRLQEVIMN